MDNTEAIKAKDLRKRYGVRTTLDGIEVSVAAGELLGPSGAGKTITLPILAGILRPDSGRVQVCGHDLFCRTAAKARPRASVAGSLSEQWTETMK